MEKYYRYWNHCNSDNNIDSSLIGEIEMDYLSDSPFAASFAEMVWLSFYQKINACEIYSYFVMAEGNRERIVGMRPKAEVEARLDDNIFLDRQRLNNFMLSIDKEKQQFIKHYQEAIEYYKKMLVDIEKDIIKINQRIDNVKNWEVTPDFQSLKEHMIGKLENDIRYRQAENFNQGIVAAEKEIANVDSRISQKIQYLESNLAKAIQRKEEELKGYDEYRKKYESLNALIHNPWAKNDSSAD